MYFIYVTENGKITYKHSSDHDVRCFIPHSLNYLWSNSPRYGQNSPLVDRPNYFNLLFHSIFFFRILIQFCSLIEPLQSIDLFAFSSLVINSDLRGCIPYRLIKCQHIQHCPRSITSTHEQYYNKSRLQDLFRTLLNWKIFSSYNSIIPIIRKLPYSPDKAFIPLYNSNTLIAFLPCSSQ